MSKAKRKPFTDKEKEYIYEKMVTAKDRGLDLETVAIHLSDELGASKFTVRNIYNQERVRLRDLKNEVKEVNDEEIEKVTEETPADIKELITLQTNVLLDRLEEVTAERDSWKEKYEKLVIEHDKIKDKLINQFLS